MELRPFIQKIIAGFKKDNAIEMGQTSLVKACYHAARYGIKDAYLADLVQETIEIFKEKMAFRESFGLFYAALKSSFTKHMIYFSKHEYEKFKKFPKASYGPIIRHV